MYLTERAPRSYFGCRFSPGVFILSVALLAYCVGTNGFLTEADEEHNRMDHNKKMPFQEEFPVRQFTPLHYERNLHLPPSETFETSSPTNFEWLSRFCKIVEANPVRTFSSLFLKAKKLMDYHWVPHDFQLFSKVINNLTNCSNVHSSLYQNFLQKDERTKPVWLHNSPKIGSCPTQFILRDLGEDRIPREVLEAKCSCEGDSCSSDGYECLPISRMITVWIFRSGLFHPDLEEVNFACACMKRPGDFSNSLESPELQA